MISLGYDLVGKWLSISSSCCLFCIWRNSWKILWSVMIPDMVSNVYILVCRFWSTLKVGSRCVFSDCETRHFPCSGHTARGAGLRWDPSFGGMTPRMASSQGRGVLLRWRHAGQSETTATVGHFMRTKWQCGWVVGCSHVWLQILPEDWRHMHRWDWKLWGWTRTTGRT